MSCSRVTILSLLDAYTQAHEEAQIEQKSCVWHLFKARQSQGRRGALVDGLLQGADVREDLYARKVVKEVNVEKEPALVSSSSSEEGNLNKDPKPMFVSSSSSLGLEEEHLRNHFLLVDTVEETKKKQEMDKENSTNKSPAADDNNAMGMRRRKGNKTTETTTAKNDTAAEWTIVDEEEDEEMNAVERLRKANPIDFFGGLPPKELRRAQEEAEKMLASYIQAANIIVAIQKSLTEE